MAALRWAQVLHYGSGQHVYDLQMDTVKNFRKSFLATQLIYFTNAVLTKASLLLLYCRIFGVVRGFRWALWIFGNPVIFYYIACTITSIAGCSPIAKFRDLDFLVKSAPWAL